MTPRRQALIVAVAMLIAAILQGRVAHAIAIRSAEPDFVLIVLACGAILNGTEQGAFLGFWGGVLTASLSTVNFGTYLASRTIAGALASSLQQLMIRDSVLVPPLIVLITTLVAQIVYSLMAPSMMVHHFKLWSHAIGGSALYNCLLAFPVYWFFRRLSAGYNKETPFAAST
jgi:rod shape-determining protein MreD